MDTITNPVTCEDCESIFDLDTDHLHWANLSEGWLCESCYESESQYASTVLLFGPDYPDTGDGPARIYVADRFSQNMWGDEPDLDVKRTYTPTDGWRGYYTTTIDGWVEVGLEGWTTGGWGDSTAMRKRPFNEWVEGLADEAPPMNVAVATDPTSNVFSTAITVYVEEANREAFDEWLNGDKEVLHGALG